MITFWYINAIPIRLEYIYLFALNCRNKGASANLEYFRVFQTNKKNVMENRSTSKRCWNKTAYIFGFYTCSRFDFSTNIYKL